MVYKFNITFICKTNSKLVTEFSYFLNSIVIVSLTFITTYLGESSNNIVSDYYGVQAMADYYYVGGGAALMMNEDPILDAVQETVELVVDECGSVKKYKEMLASQYLTDHLFRFYNAAEECATELFYILVQDLGVIESSDDYIDAYFESDDFIRTNHIFLEGVTEENLALAETLHAQLKASMDRELELIMLKGIYCADFEVVLYSLLLVRIVLFLST